MVSQSKKVEEFKKLVDVKEKHKGQLLIHQLEHLSTSLYIVMKNYNEMVTNIKQYENKYEILSQKNIKEYRLFMREINRHLHNYLASIKSLIDHTCRFRDNLNIEELKKECEGKLKILTDQNCTVFVKQFRNYIQHFDLPIVASHLRFYREKTDEALKSEGIKINLDKEGLLAWNGWNQKSKDYINNYSGEFEIVEIFKEYNKLNIEYNRWFYRKVIEWHREDLASLRQLEKKMYGLGKDLGII